VKRVASMAERAILRRCREKRKSQGLLELSRMDNFGDVDVVEPPREKSRNAEEAAAETRRDFWLTNVELRQNAVLHTAFNNTNKNNRRLLGIAGVCNTKNVYTERENPQIILLTSCIVSHLSKTFLRCIYSAYQNIEIISAIFSIYFYYIG